MNTMSRPPIYFYVPPDKPISDWPQSFQDDWISFGNGPNIWSYFTPRVLQHYGYDVNITTSVPDSGILLTHVRHLPQRRFVPDGVMLVGLRADDGRNHMAHMHVVQNYQQTFMKGRDVLEKLFAPGISYYIPYWPQPGLIPRDAGRGDLFTNVTYFGLSKNFAPELLTDSWMQSMEREGINFRIVEQRPRWHDYSDVDAICAIRSFDFKPHYRKPPSKLVNAWLAGVPAILGAESAYRALRENELDYIEVESRESTYRAILRLRDDLAMRRGMVDHGHQRGRDYTHESIAKRWMTFFDDIAIPAYWQWRQASPNYRRMYYFLRGIRVGIKKV